MCWLIKLTENTTSSLVSEKYINFPTNLWYLSLCIGSLNSSDLFLALIRVSHSLHPSISVLVRRSSIYFCWETLILFFDLIASVPKKFHICSRSLTSNSVVKVFFSLSISSILPWLGLYHQHRISILFFSHLQCAGKTLWDIIVPVDTLVSLSLLQIYRTMIWVIVWGHTMTFLVYTPYLDTLCNGNVDLFFNSPFKRVFYVHLLKKSIQIHY